MGGLLVLLLLSAGVMLCWLGIFLSLPARQLHKIFGHSPVSRWRPFQPLLVFSYISTHLPRHVEP
jgi:hypothetical protein